MRVASIGNKNARTHGLYRENKKMHDVWAHMRAKCRNKNHREYNDYGGRGIMVCDEWYNSFEIFYNWAISHGYENVLSIDRKNNNGDYCPDNCRWTTMIVQQNNTRKNVWLERDGECHTLTEWCRILNRPESTSSKRYNDGLSFDKIFSNSKRVRRSIENGQKS